MLKNLSLVINEKFVTTVFFFLFLSNFTNLIFSQSENIIRFKVLDYATGNLIKDVNVSVSDVYPSYPLWEIRLPDSLKGKRTEFCFTSSGFITEVIKLRPTLFPLNVEVVMKRDPSQHWSKGRDKSIIQPEPKYENVNGSMQRAQIGDTCNYIFGKVSLVFFAPLSHEGSKESPLHSKVGYVGNFVRPDSNGNYKIFIPDTMLNKRVSFVFEWNNVRRRVIVHLNRFPIRMDIDVKENYFFHDFVSNLKPSYFSLLFSNSENGLDRNFIFGKVLQGNVPIPFGEIIIFSGDPKVEIRTVADNEGNFRLNIPDELLNSKVILIFGPQDGPWFGDFDERVVSLTCFPKKLKLVHQKNRSWRK